MIIISGTIEIAAEDVPTASAVSLTMMQETAKEPGCIDYVFSLELGTEGTFRLFEKWVDEDALNSHFGAPHMADFLNALAEVNITGREIWRYDDVSEPSAL